ncbi:MAG: hypothetical protein HUJ98_12275 [Bacteroidaceae bacterium]|nr:hypothetical protein [Bacteroidaceae bacterium]
MATSSMLLPVAIVVSLLFWLFLGFSDLYRLLGFAAEVVCTVCIMELNNKNILLRVRSRMVSAIFIVVWTACVFLHPLQLAHFAALCLILAYQSLFRAYQQVRSSQSAFNAFLCIGMSAVVVPQLLLLAIPFVFAFGSFQALNPRSFSAMLLGLIAPVWVGGSYAYLTDSVSVVLEHLRNGWAWSADAYLQLTVQQLGMMLLLLILDLFSISNLFRYSYKDKIRTRMLYYFMAWMTLGYVGLIVAFPQQFNTMLALFVVNSSPLIAHYFALAEGKVPRALFVLALISIVVLSQL